MLGMEIGTLIALIAMLISLFGAAVKFVDRRRQLNKEQVEVNKKKTMADVERDSIVVRGAEGALLLMEKTLNTANQECEKRINELEEENGNLRCEIREVREELRTVTNELKELNNRVRRIE